ncbi:MAG: hypothetical protein AVDCRST_MAG85-67, partial [uncultured Solirubrobacteraceae bacterium]
EPRAPRRRARRRPLVRRHRRDVAGRGRDRARRARRRRDPRHRDGPHAADTSDRGVAGAVRPGRPARRAGHGRGGRARRRVVLGRALPRAAPAADARAAAVDHDPDAAARHRGAAAPRPVRRVRARALDAPVAARPARPRAPLRQLVLAADAGRRAGDAERHRLHRHRRAPHGQVPPHVRRVV